MVEFFFFLEKEPCVPMILLEKMNSQKKREKKKSLKSQDMPLSTSELFTSAVHPQCCFSPMQNIASLFYHISLLGSLL